MSTSSAQFASRTGRAQRGAVAVEFALVFVLFFVIMYGIVAYGMIFAIRHSLEHAASEGARAAVQDVGARLADRISLADATARNAVAWLGARAPKPAVTAPPCPDARFYCVRVALNFNYAADPIVPPLPGLGIALPATISAQATVQLAGVTP